MINQKNMPRKNEVQLAPTLQHQIEAAMGILARYHWDKYSIIVTDFSRSSEFIDAAYSYQDESVYNKTYYSCQNYFEINDR